MERWRLYDPASVTIDYETFRFLHEKELSPLNYSGIYLSPCSFECNTSNCQMIGFDMED